MVYITSETVGSPPINSNATSRIGTLAGVLETLTFGDPSGIGKAWGDWGAMWNRIYSAAIWTPNNSDLTPVEVPYGKIFYSGNNRTEQVGTGCNPFTVTHTAGTVAPVTKTITYGTVLSSLTGSPKCWITQNLGASNQATSATDATEPSAGWYWQFNRKQGYKHDGTTLTPSWTITSISENLNWETANDPCTILLGTGWRLPTNTEWTSADGPWASPTDAFASVLKLHIAGYLDLAAGALVHRGVNCGYWSSTQGSITTGWNYAITSSVSVMSVSTKAYGFTARCLKD